MEGGVVAGEIFSFIGEMFMSIDGIDERDFCIQLAGLLRELDNVISSEGLAPSKLACDAIICQTEDQLYPIEFRKE
jgi:hypothetical protein